VYIRTYIARSIPVYRYMYIYSRPQNILPIGPFQLLFFTSTISYNSGYLYMYIGYLSFFRNDCIMACTKDVKQSQHAVL